jgi:hypothetical protein
MPRDLQVRHRTQLVNALRGHLAEYGWLAPRGKARMTILANLLDEQEMASAVPAAARAMFQIMTDMLAELDDRIGLGQWNRTPCPASHRSSTQWGTNRSSAASRRWVSGPSGGC